MELSYNPDTPTGAEVTIRMNKSERDALGKDVGLPILLHRTMEAIIALRTGERPAGTSTTVGNWADMIRQANILAHTVEGARDASVRAFAAAEGSHGQLGKALGIPRSTAQSRREALLARSPSPWEPRLSPLRDTERLDAATAADALKSLGAA